MDIKLNLINRSNDHNNSDIVIFSKNVATEYEEPSIAWTVIQNCGLGSHHPFSYPMASEVAYADSWGNYTAPITALPGQRFEAVKNMSGDVIQLSTEPAAAPDEIEMANALEQGAINALVYKDGRVFAQKTGVAPGQKAVFEFKPTIWIGVVSQIVEGQVMNSAILSAVNTELSLLGIASADIVMSGGGNGPEATPFEFTLENIVMA
ncbi:hypothetical protein HZY97_12510 [Sphingomonas sp. R-74633]|uniref:hypothetical protein n=1 Tax=Sphingomonas sp. R-74633 TaxID=2751188 RepID=UPI0015D169CC|nr:hypothetical protein [Sphingomonas sp. R-74633]NYT41586.1 hypothetical protein [Sphingomonas sp. R-74633]